MDLVNQLQLLENKLNKADNRDHNLADEALVKVNKLVDNNDSLFWDFIDSLNTQNLDQADALSSSSAYSDKQSKFMDSSKYHYFNTKDPFKLVTPSQAFNVIDTLIADLKF